MTPRRLGLLVATAVVAPCALGGVLLPLAEPAAAEAPTVQAWWNAAHQGVQPPAPPDVPPDGLFVQGAAARPLFPESPTAAGTPVGAQAVAGLTFVLPQGAVIESLVLPIVGDLPASTSVLACVATERFQPVQNGPVAQTPQHDCEVSVEPSIDPEAGALVFAGDLTDLVRGTSLSFVMLPGFLDRIVLAKPGPGSLRLRGSGSGSAISGTPPLSGGPGPSFDGARSSPSAPTLSSGGATFGSGSSGSNDAAALEAPVNDPVAAEPETAPALAGPQFGPSATSLGGPEAVVPLDARTRTLLLLALLALGAAYVLMTSGSAAGAAPAAAVRPRPRAEVSQSLERGVGRFRRARDTAHVPL